MDLLLPHCLKVMKPAGKSPSPQGKCTVCRQFLAKWNTHTICVKCQDKEGGFCTPDAPCVHCSGWDDPTWTLYTHAAQEARVRRQLSFPGGRSSRSTPVKPPGPPSSPGARSAGWIPPRLSQAYRDFLLKELTSLSQADLDYPQAGQAARRDVSPAGSDALPLGR